MMDWITALDDLHAHYGTPKSPALRKVTSRLTPAYAGWIARSRFCILSTVGPTAPTALRAATASRW